MGTKMMQKEAPHRSISSGIKCCERKQERNAEFQEVLGKTALVHKPIRDSSRESSVIAGGHDETEHTDLQDAELPRV